MRGFFFLRYDYFKNFGRELSVTCIRDESSFFNLNLTTISFAGKPVTFVIEVNDTLLTVSQKTWYGAVE